MLILVQLYAWIKNVNFTLYDESDLSISLVYTYTNSYVDIYVNVYYLPHKEFCIWLS